MLLELMPVSLGNFPPSLRACINNTWSIKCQCSFALFPKDRLNANRCISYLALQITTTSSKIDMCRICHFNEVLV